MTSFLFWNINKKPIEHLIRDLVHGRSIDIVLLAECDNPGSVVHSLNESTGRPYVYHPNPVDSRVKVFSCFPMNAIKSWGDYTGVTFRRLELAQEILLVGVHLPSKRYMTDDAQQFQATRIIHQIRAYENQVGHSRTVVVGDFNMSPFEPGLTAAVGFHTTASRQIAGRVARQVQGESYQFFYNPMWSYLGDRSPGPPGTYYYDNAAMVNLFWYMFDQVLVRPELLPQFPDGDVEIITMIGDTILLLPNGQPDRRTASDHLPILFTLDVAAV